MELIYNQDFYKVWASKVGDYFVLWSSDYPTKANLICTCDDMDEAVEIAKLYVWCKTEDVPF